MHLSAGNVGEYLAGVGLWAPGAPLAVRELGGGVSNTVLLVEDEERRWVVKQSLEKLRVRDDWRSERSRIFSEAEALQALGPALGRAAVPQVVHVDRENYLFVMSAAPPGAAMWKEALLEGQVDLGVARQAGRLLALLIGCSRRDPLFQTTFADRTVFDQLRLDPYYRTTAARHPDLGPIFDKLIEDSGRVRTAIVHGDYSPKNLLVKDGEIFLIDFEVVHWGDPAFDAAFLLNHLFLKAFHQPSFGPLYFAAAREFWRELSDGTRGEALTNLESMTVRHLGALMLARIDGKSPVEYIREERTKERVRQFARRLLLAPPEAVAEAIELYR